MRCGYDRRVGRWNRIRPDLNAKDKSVELAGFLMRFDQPVAGSEPAPLARL
jgi:hypothetical protein